MSASAKPRLAGRQPSVPWRGAPGDDQARRNRAGQARAPTGAPVRRWRSAVPSVCAPGIVGAGIKVPVSGGRFVPYANLDYAASAPCLAAVQHAVAEALPYYSSVHRGAGYASQLTTARYERARQTVREFLGARGCDSVIFTRNTTDAMNLLAQALPPGTTVVVFESEHHAALLPGPAATARSGCRSRHPRPRRSPPSRLPSPRLPPGRGCWSSPPPPTSRVRSGRLPTWPGRRTRRRGRWISPSTRRTGRWT